MPGINWTERTNQIVMKALRESGLFVVCGDEHPNFFSTHWLATGWMWNKPIVIVPVREHKLSQEIISQTGEFCVCIPYKDLRHELMLTDHLSGREHNKFEELHLHPKRARHLSTYVISDCGMHLECRVLFTGQMDAANIAPVLYEDIYHQKKFHQWYFAEIIDVYET